MNYTKNDSNNCNYLMIPSSIENFKNTKSYETIDKKERPVIVFSGYINKSIDDYVCPYCGNTAEINDSYTMRLKHLPFGSTFTSIEFPHIQFKSKKCRKTYMQKIPFKADNHEITIQLKNYTEQLLSTNNITKSRISEITGLDRNIVGEIDSKRLKNRYTQDGKLIKPERQARYLGIDEFSLHKNHTYATHIIDLETGHILWIQQTKKKQVVYDFIEHVGLE